jgi:NAD(P)-dependent dehydrogenase (short-subunit alcohol dehydrogenase family)
LEIARQLGQKGLTVVLGARDEAKGRAATEALRGEGIDAHFVRLDVQNEADVAALPDYFKSNFGRLDVLVNNAGVAEWQSDTVDVFRKTLDVNVIGQVAVTYALLPLLRESPAGRIVNQSSMLGSLTVISSTPELTGFVNPAYTTSKAALNALTVALSIRLKDTRLKINAAHPGWVKTDLGGEQAPMNVVDGAKTAVMLATLPDDGPTGALFHMDISKPMPW